MFKVEINQRDINQFERLRDQCELHKLDWRKCDNFSFWIKFFLEKVRERENNGERAKATNNIIFEEKTLEQFIEGFSDTSGIDPRTIKNYYNQEMQSPTYKNGTVKEETFRKFIIAFGENSNFKFPPKSFDKENINETINKYFKKVLSVNTDEDWDYWGENLGPAESIDKVKKEFSKYDLCKCYLISKYFDIYYSLAADNRWDFLWYYNISNSNTKKQLKKLLSQIQISIMDLNSIIENQRIKMYRDIKNCLNHQDNVKWLMTTIKNDGYQGEYSPPQIREFLWSSVSKELYGGVEVLHDLMRGLATINLADVDILVAFEASPQKKQLFYIAKGLYEDELKKPSPNIGGQSARDREL